MTPLRFGMPLVCFLAVATALAGEKPPTAPPEKISFYRQIRPILQANCAGCHQSAKASGDYRMTTFATLLRGGGSGEAAIVPGKPEKSYLVELITAVDGKAEMPKDKPPLATQDVALLRRWIEEGAVDDSLPNTRPHYDAAHPPVYVRPPVVSALDFSADGSLLAVAGFHEALLLKADGSRAARLVGRSDRIESVRFSPDGTRLLVAGGVPCQFGDCCRRSPSRTTWSAAEAGRRTAA